VKIRKAVITAAGKNQRSLPLQTLVDRDGHEKSVLHILVEHALAGNVEEVCVVTWPGDEGRYLQAVSNFSGTVRFIAQTEPHGYGHAIYSASAFTGDEPFLHLVGDHLYVSPTEQSCAQRIVEVAEAGSCAVSSVQATRETLLHRYGTVGGRRQGTRRDLYRVETVIEKPTPTEAEQRLISPGLRTGHFLCFFGLHVLTPTVMEVLGKKIAENRGPVTLTSALAQVAQQEEYLALEDPGRRYDIGARYGLLNAQLALALSGPERSEVMAQLLELLAYRELVAASVAESGR
jgi:UTP--glucose-1-phosphate uridylyltransferase